MSRMRTRAAIRRESGNWPSSDAAARGPARHRGPSPVLCAILAAGMLRTDALAASRERIDVSRVGSSVEESAPLAQRPGLRRSGTAFFVARDGDLLTTAHTLRGCKRIEVWPDDDSRLVASLVSVDTALDVAVLATHRSVSRIAVARAAGRRACRGVDHRLRSDTFDAAAARVHARFRGWHRGHRRAPSPCDSRAAL